MRVALLVTPLVAVLAGPAAAQPGLTPPSYTYAGPPVSLQLTDDDVKLLNRGEISDDRALGGGIASIVVGFGVGQAIQGRWGEAGWIITLGEGGSLALFFVGLMNALACDFGPGQPKSTVPSRSTSGCDNWGGVATIGMVGLAAFHIGGIVDAFTAPPRRNGRVRALRARLGAPRFGVAPFVAPTRSGDGGVAGFSLRF